MRNNILDFHTLERVVTSVCHTNYKEQFFGIAKKFNGKLIKKY